jgi:hypothetical protein
MAAARARSALAIKAMPRGRDGKPRGDYVRGARILRSSEQIDERHSRCGVTVSAGRGDLRPGIRRLNDGKAGPGDS